MSDKENIDNIEIRSNEVTEILGATPSRVLRMGISSVLGVVLVIFIGSWFFKYPNIINSKITLTTQNPPAFLLAKSNGKITHLFVENNQIVEENEIIAIIENPTNYNDLLYLDSIIDTLVSFRSFNDDVNLMLGELQPYFSLFLKNIKDYKHSIKLNYYFKKIEAVKERKKDYQDYYNCLLEQKKIKNKELSISKSQFERDLELYKDSIYSKAEFEKSEKLFLKEKLSLKNAITNLVNTQITINELNQQIIELNSQKTKEFQEKKIAIEETLDNLKGQINKWKQSYLILSPIKGKVTFTNIWSKHQNIKINDIVATVIPINKTNIIGKIEIPVNGVGKVKLGQKVNIKLSNFPYMEFGLLKGYIKSISLVPFTNQNQLFYTADVDIDDNLISNYGKHLKFTHKMTGTAEIFTDDIRLIERFFNPLKALWKNNQTN